MRLVTRHRWALSWPLAAMALLPWLPAQASEAPCLPPELEDRLPSLVLAGSGDFDVLFWDVYTAALWAPQGEYSPLQPHALAIRYERDFKGAAIAERSIEEIRKLGLGSNAEHDEWLAAMKGLFPDVSDGDQLTGVHYPGEKVVFYRNDERIGEVPDAAFAEAFFAIWLDEDTSAPDLRERLLGMAGNAGASPVPGSP